MATQTMDKCQIEYRRKNRYGQKDEQEAEEEEEEEEEERS